MASTISLHMYDQTNRCSFPSTRACAISLLVRKRHMYKGSHIVRQNQHRLGLAFYGGMEDNPIYSTILVGCLIHLMHHIVLGRTADLPTSRRLIKMGFAGTPTLTLQDMTDVSEWKKRSSSSIFLRIVRYRGELVTMYLSTQRL